MKKGLKILLYTDSLMSFSLGMLGPIYALFVEEVGGSLLDASWAFFTYMLTAGFLIVLISKWEDRFEHKEKLVILGYALTALGFLSYIFVFNQTTLILTQILLGVASAVLAPAFDASYSHFVLKQEESYEWGLWEAMYYFVTAIAAVVGGYIAEIFGFTTLFAVMFFISLIGFVYALLLFKGDAYLNEE